MNPFAGLKKKKELTPNEQAEEIARLNELVKTKDKEIARLTKELEGFKKEHNKNSRRSLSGNAPVLSELKEEKGYVFQASLGTCKLISNNPFMNRKNKLSLRKIFTGGSRDKKRDGPATLSEEFIMEEEEYLTALTVIQAFIRRRNAMEKKSSLCTSRSHTKKLYERCSNLMFCSQFTSQARRFVRCLSGDYHPSRDQKIPRHGLLAETLYVAV